MKIAVIGYSGSGKSTLARTLGAFYHCKVLHLDTVQFTPNWVERDREESITMVRDFLDREESWVIDGNYSWCLQERRLEEADRIIFMDFGRWTCLSRAWKRYRTYRGKSRPDMTEGCDEKLDWEFIRWILWDGRTAERKAHFAAIGVRYPEKMTVIHDQLELDAFTQRYLKTGDG